MALYRTSKFRYRVLVGRVLNLIVGLRRALLGTLSQKNAVIIPPPKGKWPSPVLLKYAGAKSWSAFAQGASMWSIETENGSYQIVSYRNHPDGYWAPDHKKTIRFAPGTLVDAVIDHMIAIQQEAAQNNPSPVITGRPDRAAHRSQPPPAGGDDWVRLPPGPERNDELADFIEWMANAPPEDERTIRAEIKRYFSDVGDEDGAAVLDSAFTELLRPNLTRKDRQSILDRIDVFSRIDPGD